MLLYIAVKLRNISHSPVSSDEEKGESIKIVLLKIVYSY